LKVIVVDPLVRTHHVEHAVFACEWFVSCGDEVVFVAWKPHPALTPLTELPIAIVYAGEKQVDDEMGVEQHSIQGQLRMRQAVRRAIREATQRGADAVHLLFLDWFVLGVSAALASKHSIPVYAAMYWLYFERPEGERRPAIMKMKYLLEWHLTLGLLASGRLSGLFVFSEETRTQLVRRGANPQRVSVLPDPVIVPAVVPDLLEARRRMRIPEDDPVFLFFGETRLDKGADILLDALPSVKSRCVVLFAGPATELTHIDFVRASKKVPSHVQLVWRLDLLPEPDIQGYFAACDCVVLPYRRLHLGTSGPMQRAAAFGRPMIVADVGVLGGIARQHRIGLVVEPESPTALAEAIDRMISTPRETRAAWEVAAREYGSRNDRRIFGRLIRAEIIRGANNKGTIVTTNPAHSP
jgi:glycosyltransferase involved in cell wall biosynthesis